MKIPVVNEQDEIIGHKDRSEKTLEDIIRITAIWITDRDGNILLAQRSFSKKDNPGKWGPAVAGTVEEGESYEENAYKELREELGLENFILNPLKKILYTSSTGRKYCYFFGLEIPQETKIEIQKDEVEQVKWLSKRELKEHLKNKPEDFVQAFSILQEFLTEI
ncbi:MAG: NUDIX domain-containing protein [Candidatus Pacebacteria bacterium]|nr:NUDIX domain-containing protein [Candidatus Paceibacterota bacterium]MBP9839883.1 NUDIX domain-containing protein [Candidatus Paceibacterota bacterium]